MVTLNYLALGSSFLGVTPSCTFSFVHFLLKGTVQYLFIVFTMKNS
jgi:hypothetical protein